jgi:NADH dehydrogenase [ubiquinone] 1 alpha subcomplex assembly factor 7
VVDAALAGVLASDPAAPCGQIRETCPEAVAVIAAVARRMARSGGAAIIIDYGSWDGHGDTLQALRRHRPEPVLAHPGEADLTAHVDFRVLADLAAAGGLCRSRMVVQGDWLMRLGVGARAQRLAAAGDGGAMAALHRLTAAEEMGHLFKVLAFWAAGAAVPPGFEPLEN